MSKTTTITVVDDNAVNVVIDPPPVVSVVIDPPPAVSVLLSATGVQGPPGPIALWEGTTPPDPQVYPLWLDTST